MTGAAETTIDRLLNELLPTTRLGPHPIVAAEEPGGSRPELPPRPVPHRAGGRRRWRRALILAAFLLTAGAVFAGGLVVGRQTGSGSDPAASTQLESEPAALPIGTAAPAPGTGPAEQPGTGPAEQPGAVDPEAADPTGLVAGYREALAARDLVSADLSDDDLTRFGYAACVFAASAESPADFDTFRSAAVADADSSLTDAEMAVVVDTAVIVFCPADADRLGVG